MYSVSAITFMYKIPAMTIIVLDILATIYYFNAIVVDSNPKCVTNNSYNNKNKYSAPDNIFRMYFHGLINECESN